MNFNVCQNHAAEEEEEEDEERGGGETTCRAPRHMSIQTYLWSVAIPRQKEAPSSFASTEQL